MIHLFLSSTDNREELCKKCSSSLHFSTSETKLLLFLASRSNGFHPSAKYIAQQIGTSRRNVFYLRDALVRHGVIAVTNHNIIIDWQRIRLFSTLDPAMTNKNAVILPVSVNPVDLHKAKRLVEQLQTCSIPDACRILNSITEEEFAQVQRIISKQKAAPVHCYES